MEATEARNYDKKARGIESRSQNDETEAKKKPLYFNTKENLQNYYENIEAYNEAERLLTAKPTEGTGFQTSRHPYMMTKDGKYGKLTIDVPKLVEKHRLVLTEVGRCFLMKKLILILLILLDGKRYDLKRNTPIYQKLYSKD